MSIEVNDTLVLINGGIDRWPSAEFAFLRPGYGKQGEEFGGAKLLVVVDEVERHVEVVIGETFAVGDQAWRLESVSREEPYEATIRRIS